MDGPDVTNDRLRKAIVGEKDKSRLTGYRLALHISEFFDSGKQFVPTYDGPTP